MSRGQVTLTPAFCTILFRILLFRIIYQPVAATEMCDRFRMSLHDGDD